MTQQDNFDDFFAGIGEGGAPGFDFGDRVGNGVKGTIVKMHQTIVTEPKTNEPKLDRNGREIPQLNVTLQTTLRDWKGVKPKSIPKDKDGNPLPASEDNGERRVFVKYQMRRALADAFRAAGATGPRLGGVLGVKLSGFVDVGKANDLPEFEAMYEAPSEAADFFEGQETREEEKETVPASRPKEQVEYDEVPF